jgi:hypothetical protein
MPSSRRQHRILLDRPHTDEWLQQWVPCAHRASEAAKGGLGGDDGRGDQRTRQQEDQQHRAALVVVPHVLPPQDLAAWQHTCEGLVDPDTTGSWGPACPEHWLSSVTSLTAVPSQIHAEAEVMTGRIATAVSERRLRTWMVRFLYMKSAYRMKTNATGAISMPAICGPWVRHISAWLQHN